MADLAGQPIGEVLWWAIRNGICCVGYTSADRDALGPDDRATGATRSSARTRTSLHRIPRVEAWHCRALARVHDACR